MKLFTTSFLATMITLNMPFNIDSVNHHSIDQGQKPLFSFGIITDVQYVDSDSVGTMFHRQSLVKLREAVAAIKKNSAEFMINLGDIIDHDYESYKQVLGIIDSSGLKVYHVTGNHDYSVDPRLRKKLPLQQPSKEGYYSFIYNEFRFIFLNGNEISIYASNNKKKNSQAEEYISAMKGRGEINAINWNGGIGNEQLIWLDNQLKEAAGKNEKVFIMCHFPVFPENLHNLLNYKDVLTILEKYKNIIAWFNGHNHKGNYGNFNMIHFITMKGMVETEATNSFALVEVYRNKIWIKGSGREKNQILAY